MWCEITHRCLTTIHQDLSCCYFQILLHIRWYLQKVCLYYLPFSFYLTNNRLPCGTSFQICGILRWSGVLIYSCFRCPINWMICGRILHSYCKWSWRDCSCFFSPTFISRIFSSGYFYCFLLPPNSVFRNQRIYFLRYFYSIFEIFTLQYTLAGLYSSGGTSNICAFVLSSYFSDFPLFYWASNLSYIVHWNICPYLFLCTWYFMCSTRL